MRGNLTQMTPGGFRAAGVAAGLKSVGLLDVAVVVNDGPSRAAAGVFTSNRVKAAPVLWSEQVMILNSQSAHSYYSTSQTERHFGLGHRSAVDVSVEFYPSAKRIEKKNAKSNAALIVAED